MTPSTYDGSGVRVNAVVHSSDGSVIPINLPLGDVFGLATPENYSCSGGSLTFMRPDRPDLHFRHQEGRPTSAVARLGLRPTIVGWACSGPAPL
jgi:hypothetical protein